MEKRQPQSEEWVEPQHSHWRCSAARAEGRPVVWGRSDFVSPIRCEEATGAIGWLPTSGAGFRLISAVGVV